MRGRNNKGFILPIILVINLVIMMAAITACEEALRFYRVYQSLRISLINQDTARQTLLHLKTDGAHLPCYMYPSIASSLREEPLLWWEKQGCRLQDTPVHFGQWLVLDRLGDRVCYKTRQGDKAGRFIRFSVLQVDSANTQRHVAQMVRFAAMDPMQDCHAAQTVPYLPGQIMSYRYD